MNRLTHKDIAIQLDKDIESTITISENVSRDIYLKCAKLEDIMEKYNLNVVCDIEHIFIQFKSAMNDIRELLDENKKLKEKWQKLKNTISSKQYIKDKTNSNFVAMIGAMGVEIFCEMLLKEMENLELGEKK